MFYLVTNPEDRFSSDEAHFKFLENVIYVNIAV